MPWQETCAINEREGFCCDDFEIALRIGARECCAPRATSGRTAAGPGQGWPIGARGAQHSRAFGDDGWGMILLVATNVST